jgi:hypothetical protein
MFFPPGSIIISNRTAVYPLTKLIQTHKQRKI